MFGFMLIPDLKVHSENTKSSLHVWFQGVVDSATKCLVGVAVPLKEDNTESHGIVRFNWNFATSSG